MGARCKMHALEWKGAEQVSSDRIIYQNKLSDLKISSML